MNRLREAIRRGHILARDTSRITDLDWPLFGSAIRYAMIFGTFVPVALLTGPEEWSVDEATYQELQKRRGDAS